MQVVEFRAAEQIYGAISSCIKGWLVENVDDMTSDYGHLSHGERETSAEKQTTAYIPTSETDSCQYFCLLERNRMEKDLTVQGVAASDQRP